MWCLIKLLLGTKYRLYRKDALDAYCTIRLLTHVHIAQTGVFHVCSVVLVWSSDPSIHAHMHTACASGKKGSGQMGSPGIQLLTLPSSLRTTWCYPVKRHQFLLPRTDMCKSVIRTYYTQSHTFIIRTCGVFHTQSHTLKYNSNMWSTYFMCLV